MPGRDASQSDPAVPADLAAMTPAELLAAYRGGRDEAFQRLIDHFQPELFRFLLRFVNNRAVAEDLFQETFLQVHLSAETFDTSKRFKPWLFTIGANKARDYLRRNKRRRMLSLSGLASGGGKGGDGPSFVDLMEGDLPGPTEVAQDAEARRRVLEAVEQLPDHLREVLLLAYFEQLAYKEIAEMLSIPLGTVKSRLHAAVGTFAELWKTRYAEDE